MAISKAEYIDHKYETIPNIKWFKILNHLSANITEQVENYIPDLMW